MNFLFPRRMIDGAAAALCSLAIAYPSHGAELTLSSTARARIGALERNVSDLDPGELLIGELNCAACHRVSPQTELRLQSKKAPLLGRDGLAVTPQYLREFLSDPSHAKPGTTMPDLLHGVPAAQKYRVIDALVHFLISTAPPDHSSPMGADSFLIDHGRTLYHTIGCVACHAPQEPASKFGPTRAAADAGAPAVLSELERNSIPLDNLASKMTVEELARFLLDPLKSGPSGRMPSLNLTQREATAIAIYLLREQAAHPAAGMIPKKIRGLSYQYFEAPFAENPVPLFDALSPKGSGTVDHFTIAPRQRPENVGLRFTGTITLARAGSYTFYSASDDGSRLYVDSHLVVQNDGTHSMTEKSGTIPLKAGDHSIMVTWFNAGGPAGLIVSYEGPGLRKQEIPAAILSHLGAPMLPLRPEQFAVNMEKANAGRDYFKTLGCAACHSINGDPLIALTPLPAKALDELKPDLDSTCLSPLANAKLPQYFLSDTQREAIVRVLGSSARLRQAPTAAEVVTHTMAALNCFACHSRNQAGGPAPERLPYFASVGDLDLGDEGRIPPHLNGTGNKLRPEWMRDVLMNHAAVRPYMATRMPQFGAANVALLLSNWPAADGRHSSEADPAESIALAKFGRKLAGTDGLSCISCHTFAGHKSLGVPAIDLTFMPRRLRFDWFHRYLLDPQSLRPGTRMPSFWPEGKSANQQILDGDPTRQIEAIWQYLRVADRAGLPMGLIQGRMELVATNEAIVYRNFITGVSPRAIGVGYPEKANLAFNAQELTLALIWQGPFIDAARHRTGRGEGFEPPLGFNLVKFPPGPPFALLASADSAWPSAPSRELGYRFHGYILDHERRPKFHYSYENIQIEDYPVAATSELEAFFRRTLTFQSPAPVANLWFRAALGPSLERKDGSFLVNSRVTLRFKGVEEAQPVIRARGDQKELLVPIRFRGNRAEIVEEIIW